MKTHNIFIFIKTYINLKKNKYQKMQTDGFYKKWGYLKPQSQLAVWFGDRACATDFASFGSRA